MKIVIIGSGPTAMGAVYRIKELLDEKTITDDVQVLLLEKESEVGGLARSITDEMGFTWDLGVHVTGVSKYHKFTQVIDDAVKEWNNVPRCVKAYLPELMNSENPEQSYVPYPVQDAIPYFPNSVKLKALSEQIALSQQNSSENPRNFEEFAHKVFGGTLINEFIRPYNEKVWTVPLSEMNTAWVENRVPRSNTEELQRRSCLSIDELKHEDDQKDRISFRYPQLRGIGELWKIIAETIPSNWFKFNAEVAEIDVNNKQIKTTNGEDIPYDFIISTIPIVQLGKITNLCPDIGLQYSKVVLVGLGFRRPQPEFTKQLSWLYFPQKKIPFYRCTFISNFNDLMTPDPNLYWSVICEIGMTTDGIVNKQEIIDSTLKAFIQCGITTEDVELIDNWIFELPFGYPIPTLNRDEELSKSHQIFLQHNIYSRGRFGSWKYETANQDHSFIMGCDVVDHILFESPEQFFT